MGLNNFILTCEKDNEELRKDLDYYKNQNTRLKKQLEECKATNEVLSHELTKYKILKQDHLITFCEIPIGDIPKLITQQKKFINYLEEKINFYNNRDSYIVADILGSYDLNKIELELLEEILQKYKEIIGDKE